MGHFCLSACPLVLCILPAEIAALLFSLLYPVGMVEKSHSYNPLTKKNQEPVNPQLIFVEVSERLIANRTEEV